MNPVDSANKFCVDSCPILMLIIQALYALGENTSKSLYMYYPVHFGKIVYRHIFKNYCRIFNEVFSICLKYGLWINVIFRHHHKFEEISLKEMSRFKALFNKRLAVFSPSR